MKNILLHPQMVKRVQSGYFHKKNVEWMIGFVKLLI